MSDKNTAALDLDKVEKSAKEAIESNWPFYRLAFEKVIGKVMTPEASLELIALARRASQVSAAAPADKPACPHCATKDIEFSRTCHNSDCIKYAEPESTYQGWRASEGQAQTSAAALAGMVVKATFGDHKILVPRVDLSNVEIETLVYFAAQLADKTDPGATREAPDGWAAEPVVNDTEILAAWDKSVGRGHMTQTTRLDFARLIEGVVVQRLAAPTAQQSTAGGAVPKLRNVISNAIYGYGAMLEDHTGTVDAIAKSVAPLIQVQPSEALDEAITVCEELISGPNEEGASACVMALKALRSAQQSVAQAMADTTGEVK